MYFIPIILMIPFCIAEFLGRDKHNVMFKIVFSLLLFMACFRYGQGQDYYGYMINYYLVDQHSEIGYRLICEIIRSLGGSFEILILVVSLFQMLCVYRVVMLYSPYKVTSLLVLYPTVYLTYFCSGIRQGIVAAFFLGFMVKWLLEGKRGRYTIACIALSTIHSAALILLVSVFVKKFNIRFLYFCLASAATLGCFVYFMPKHLFSFIKIGSFQSQIQNTSISIIGLLERVAMFTIITWIYSSLKKNGKNYETITVLYKIYFIGFIISIAFFPWGLVSSRLPMALKAVEILLIPLFLKESKMYKQLLLTFFVCYSLFMTTKNISTYIGQGGYEGYNVITYPYLNVWDKEYAHQATCQNEYLQKMITLDIIQ